LQVTPDHRRLTTIAAIDADLAKVWPDGFNRSWDGRVRKGHKVDALMIARADGDWRRSHPETIRIEFESLFDKPDRMA
jgi:hypothetical protein